MNKYASEEWQLEPVGPTTELPPRRMGELAIGDMYLEDGIVKGKWGAEPPDKIVTPITMGYAWVNQRTGERNMPREPVTAQMNHPEDESLCGRQFTTDSKQESAEKIIALMRTISETNLEDVMNLVARHFCRHCWTDFGDGPVNCSCMRDD